MTFAPSRLRILLKTDNRIRLRESAPRTGTRTPENLFTTKFACVAAHYTWPVDRFDTTTSVLGPLVWMVRTDQIVGRSRRDERPGILR